MNIIYKNIDRKRKKYFLYNNIIFLFYKNVFKSLKTNLLS